MIYVPLGDPYSCNIELVHRALDQIRPEKPVVLLGSHAQWLDQLRRLGRENILEFRSIEGPDMVNGAGLYFIDIATPAFVSAESMAEKDRAAIAYAALEKSCDYIARAPKQARLLTCPVDKKVMTGAGFGAHGHTEYLAAKFSCDTIMILAGPKLRVALVTNHLPVKDIPRALSEELVEGKVMLLAQTLREQFGIERPKIAVTGLNPHCGDSGLFGSEEQQFIAPVIARHQEQTDFEVSGPHPADTVFHRAYLGQFDCVLAMYHDQGLGPLKTVHFDTAINVTGGLPFRRVSPDHGPARDLFMQKKASLHSFVNALNFLI